MRVGIFRRPIGAREGAKHAVKAPVLLDHDDDMFDGVGSVRGSFQGMGGRYRTKAEDYKQNCQDVPNVRLLNRQTPLPKGM